MKKLVLFASALAMLVGFNACTPEQPVQPEPVIPIGPTDGGEDVWQAGLRPVYGATTSAWDASVTDQLDVFFDGEDIQISVPFSTNEAGNDGRWQAQIFVMGKEPVVLEEGKNYKWTVKVNSNKAGIFYCKVTYPGEGNDMIINNLELAKELAAGNNTFTKVVSVTEPADDVEFVIALGQNEAGMEYTIQMSLVETTESADPEEIPEEIDSPFADMSGVELAEADAEFSFIRAIASWGDWNLSADNVQASINGDDATITIISSTVGNKWYCQSFINTGVSVEAGQSVLVSFDISCNKEEGSIETGMSIGDWDYAKNDGAGGDLEPHAFSLDKLYVSSTPKHVEMGAKNVAAAINTLRITMGLGGGGENTVFTISNLKVELSE